MNNLEKLFYRILLGYYYISINNKTYKIISPSIKTKYEAEILYEKVIEDNKYDKVWLTEEEIKFQLAVQNIWNSKKDQELKDTKNLLDNAKIELFLTYSNTNQRKKNKQHIQTVIKMLDKLQALKASFDYLSIREHANTIKNEFLIMNSIYDEHNQLKFNNPSKDSYEYTELQAFIKEILDNSIKIHEIRELARSDIFRSYASSCDLQQPIHSINDDYRYLINLHKMYENAKQHPESPSDEVINDDDALDGWFIYHNQKAEKEKKKNALLERVGGNIKNAGEVFLLTDSQEETKEIFGLNDPEARKNIAEMKRIAKEKGGVEWKDLPFVQQQLQMQANQQMSATLNKSRG